MEIKKLKRLEEITAGNKITFMGFPAFVSNQISDYIFLVYRGDGGAIIESREPKENPYIQENGGVCQKKIPVGKNYILNTLHLGEGNYSVADAQLKELEM